MDVYDTVQHEIEGEIQCLKRIANGYDEVVHVGRFELAAHHHKVLGEVHEFGRGDKTDAENNDDGEDEGEAMVSVVDAIVVWGARMLLP